MTPGAGSVGGTCPIEIFFVPFYPFLFFVKSTKRTKSKSGDAAGYLATLNVALRKPLRDSDSGLRVYPTTIGDEARGVPWAVAVFGHMPYYHSDWYLGHGQISLIKPQAVLGCS